MRRKQAAKLIDELRELEASHRNAGSESISLWQLQDILQRWQLPLLAACEGEAHSNAHIDNCSLCAPRWGFVGKFEVVS
jgi:hypothetical protein